MSMIDNALKQTMKDQLKSKVLWKNASPGSNMGAQTIPLNMAEGDTIEIIIGNAGNKMASVQLAVGDSANLYTSGTYTYRRRYTVSESGLTIAAGYQGNTVDNSATIPFAIYLRKIIGGGIE